MRLKSRSLKCLGALLVLLAVGGGVLAWHSHWERQFEAALVDLKRGKDIRQVRQLADALGKRPCFGVHSQILRGASLMRTREFDSAYRVLADIQPPPRLRHTLLLLMGECLFQSGNLVDSERAFRQAALERPDSASAHRWLAGLYHEVGAMWGALGELQEVIRLEPDHHLAYALMGQLYAEDFSRPTEASEQFLKALERNPPPEQAQAIRRELAGAQIALNDFQGALATLASAEEDVGVLSMKAECHWNLRDHSVAKEFLSRAKLISPDFRAVLLLEARMQTDNGDAASAIALLQKLVEKDPHDFTARYQLAQAYRLTGEMELSQLELARMQESKELRNRLNELYEKAIRSPLDASVREQLAKTCDQLGKHELAAKWRRASGAARQAEEFLQKP